MSVATDSIVYAMGREGLDEDEHRTIIFSPDITRVGRWATLDTSYHGTEDLVLHCKTFYLAGKVALKSLKVFADSIVVVTDIDKGCNFEFHAEKYLMFVGSKIKGVKDYAITPQRSIEGIPGFFAKSEGEVHVEKAKKAQNRTQVATNVDDLANLIDIIWMEDEVAKQGRKNPTVWAWKYWE